MVNYIRKSGKRRAQRTLPLSALPMHNVGSAIPKFPSNCAHASLIAGPHPSDLGNVQEMEPGVPGQLVRSMHRLLRAGNYMNLEIWPFFQPLQNCFDRRPEFGRVSL